MHGEHRCPAHKFSVISPDVFEDFRTTPDCLGPRIAAQSRIAKGVFAGCFINFSNWQKRVKGITLVLEAANS
jgi:hypothetical protein